MTIKELVDNEPSSPIPISLAVPYGGIAQDFREDIVFTLDIHAKNTHPGTTENCHEQLHSSFPYFRRLLSDDYMRNINLKDDTPVIKTNAQLALFHIEDRAWASITHFLIASKFKQAPEIYNKLCLDSGDPLGYMLASNIKLLFKKLPSPKDWKDRKADTWRRALLTKYVQNEDMQHALLLTGSTKLVNQQGVPQYLLMWVRTVLREEQSTVKGPPNHENIEQILHAIKEKNVKMKDAVSYLEQIKTKEPPETWDQFLQIMTDFRSEKINTPQVLERVTLLFKGKPCLMRNFLMFLPPGHEFEFESEKLICITAPNSNKIEIDILEGIVSFD